MENEIENIFRVKQRVMQGGHNIDEQDIVRRYFRSKKMFSYLKDHVDEWNL